MYDHIHMDEKFFILTKEVEQYILAEGVNSIHQRQQQTQKWV
jgi:hypothetical protein